MSRCAVSLGLVKNAGLMHRPMSELSDPNYMLTRASSGGDAWLPLCEALPLFFSIIPVT